jgi:hypothetical protein
MSSEPWGWIPYHYGRWGWERRIGWYWVPDVLWGPAWVTWRWGDIYIGWAPLPPRAEFRRGFGFRYRDFEIPNDYWVFIDGRHFQNTYLDRYILPYERNRTVIHLAQLKAEVSSRGDRVMNDGIDIDQIRRVTKQEVEKYDFREGRSPEDIKLRDRDVVLYKPDIRKNTDAKPKNVQDEDQALENLERSRLRRLESERGVDEELEAEQERERRILEQSQEEEVKVIRKKTEKEIESAKSGEEKQKIENEEKTKVNELRKKHEEEKTEISKRQKEESERVKEGRIRKKDEER